MLWLVESEAGLNGPRVKEAGKANQPLAKSQVLEKCERAERPKWPKGNRNVLPFWALDIFRLINSIKIW